MATTDARTGFRLPWSSDQRPTDESADDHESRADGSVTETEPDAQPAEAAHMTDAADPASDSAVLTAEPVRPVSPAGGKRPSKFLADLTRAMQAAAEAAREETLSRLQADAKAHIEDIHARSATEAADLRRRADDDVAAIREWSKAEIARIREETETRISARKQGLENEIDEHAALIERQIERVQSRVNTFEAEMAAFFERLLAEEDPTRFASMAENLPEPPPFDADVAAVAAAAMVSTPVSPDAPTDAWAATPDEPVVAPDPEPVVEDPEAAFAAIQAAAEAAAVAELAEASAGTATDEPAGGETVDGETVGQSEDDPRLSALAMSAGFEAAEAEALSVDANTDIEIPTIGDEALAARLAGLVPGADEAAAAAPAPSTQVVVTGLVSVASIASFKRHLGRLPGVQSVGVSSGPDGEFVFAVTHAEDVDLRDAVVTLPGFQARVTGGSDGVVEVTARDPENEA